MPLTLHLFVTLNYIHFISTVFFVLQNAFLYHLMEVSHEGITDNEKVIYKTLHILIQIYKYIENCS